MIAGATSLAVYFAYGFEAIIFPSVHVLCFLGNLLHVIWNAEVQSGATPGLDKMDEPDRWFSSIHNAWLYVNDQERWASYASLSSCVVGAAGGSILGGLLLFIWKISGPVVVASWVSGIFLMVSVAMWVTTSEYWSKTKEHDDSSYEEV